MSMYNLVFGQNPLSDLLLATLGLKKSDVGRFRDCFISDGMIAVYTRNGGGNRDCWDYEKDADGKCHCPGCVISEHLPAHPLYVRDEDDDFDCTYATIYFRFPDEFADDLKKLDSGETFEPSKRWIEAIEAISAPARKDPEDE